MVWILWGARGAASCARPRRALGRVARNVGLDHLGGLGRASDAHNLCVGRALRPPGVPDDTAMPTLRRGGKNGGAGLKALRDPAPAAVASNLQSCTGLG